MDRLTNGISSWIKPMKFLGSLAIYYVTLAWLTGYLPTSVRASRLGRTLVAIPLTVGFLEIAWIVTAAALGQPSHFNQSSPIYAISYGLAGLGATMLMVVVLTMGILIARNRQAPIAPALRLSILIGCTLAFVATMITAGYLSSGTGHWVGGDAADAGGLPLLGWSQTGGDLRVAHFFSMHALQLIPLVGWSTARFNVAKPKLVVVLASIAYAGFIVFTFFQALAGRPFI